MSGDILLASIADLLGKAIEEQVDHDKRRKLKGARNLIRDVLWGDAITRGVVVPNDIISEATVPDPAAARERHP